VLFEERGRKIDNFSYALHTFYIIYFDFLFVVDSGMLPILSPSSIRPLLQSPLRHPFDHRSNLVFVIDSTTDRDLHFIIDSLTVADVRFLIEDSQDQRRERRSKKERE
jgi:hypothetical protein